MRNARTRQNSRASAVWHAYGFMAPTLPARLSCTTYELEGGVGEAFSRSFRSAWSTTGDRQEYTAWGLGGSLNITTSISETYSRTHLDYWR
jgi:hypothetical protein